MKKERESGIELYKVIAIFLIVLSHVIQTLTEPNYVLGIGEGTFINIATATTNLLSFTARHNEKLSFSA